MAMPLLKRMSSASMTARGTTGILSSLAATTSGLSGLMAEEMTTTSAPLTFSAECS